MNPGLPLLFGLVLQLQLPFCIFADRENLKSRCNSLPNKYKFYAYDSCFVVEELAGPRSAWETKCTHISGYAGHAAVIPNIQLLNHISEHLKPAPQVFLWIGLKQANKTLEPLGNWEWLLREGKKESARFEKYKMKGLFIDNYKNLDECAVLSVAARGISDRTCSGSLSYLCQYNSKSRHFQVYGEHMKGSVESFIEKKQPASIIDLEIGCAKICRDHALCYSFAIENVKSMCYLYMDFAHSVDFPAVNNENFTLYDRI